MKKFLLILIFDFVLHFAQAQLDNPYPYNLKKTYDCNGILLQRIIPENDSSIYWQTIYTGTPCGYSNGNDDMAISKSFRTFRGQLSKRIVNGGIGDDSIDNNMLYTSCYGNVFPSFDSLFNSDSSHLSFLCPPSPDTCGLYPDWHYVARSYDFDIDSENVYHIVAKFYLPNDGYTGACDPVPTSTVYIRTNTISNNPDSIDISLRDFFKSVQRIPSSFQQFRVIDSFTENALDIRIKKWNGNLLFVLQKADSIIFKVADTSFSLLNRVGYYYNDPGNNYSYSIEDFIRHDSSYYLFYKVYSGAEQRFLNSYMKLSASLELIENKVSYQAYEYDNLFASFANKNVYYFPQGDTTLAKFVNENGDTLQTVTLPYSYRKTFFTHRKQFVCLQEEKDFGLNLIFHYLYFYDSSGRFIRKTPAPLGDTAGFYLWDYPFHNESSDFFIDKFDNIILLISYDDGTGCSHGSGPRYVYNQVNENLNAIYHVSGHISDSFSSIKNVTVELSINGHSYFTTTDDSGQFNFMPFDTGHGEIILHLDTHPEYTNTGNDTIRVVLSDTITNSFVSFLLQGRLTGIRPNSKIKVSVHPNPFNDYSTISFEYTRLTELTIRSIDGKLHQQYSGNDKYYIVRRKELPEGMYIYELRDKLSKELLNTGKIIVE